jgi:hypothetical protein
MWCDVLRKTIRELLKCALEDAYRLGISSSRVDEGPSTYTTLDGWGLLVLKTLWMLVVVWLVAQKSRGIFRQRA